MTEKEELVLRRIFSTRAEDIRLKIAYRLLRNGLKPTIPMGYRCKSMARYRLEKKYIKRMLESILLKDIV